MHRGIRTTQRLTHANPAQAHASACGTAFLHAIATPKDDGVQAQLAADDVNLRFPSKMRLNATRPSEGTTAHHIGIHAICLEADVRDVIWPAYNGRGNFSAAWVAGKTRIKVHPGLACHKQATVCDPGLQMEHACRTWFAQKKLFFAGHDDFDGTAR